MTTHASQARLDPVSRTYIVRTMLFMALYVLINAAVIAGLFDGIVGTSAGWVLAVAVALPVAGQIWATMQLLARSDEFVRVIVAKCFILAAGGTMVLWTVWGFGEAYATAAHLPGWLIYPVFWAMYALVSPFVRTSN